MLGHKTFRAFRETGFWTVRKQGVILKAWLVYARFWQCKGGKHQLRLFCRTSTHWIWESQLLRAACPRVGRNARFTESYFLQFVPRLVGLRTYWPWLHLVIMKKKKKKQAGQSWVRTNFTCLLSTLECSFMPNPSLDKDLLLLYFMHREISEYTVFSSTKF